MEQACRDEVVELHQFFEDWFTGRLADTDQAFERCEQALAKSFVLISPRGVTDTCAQLLPSIRAAHGRRPEMRIWIEDLACRQLSDTMMLVTYREWQDDAGQVTGRLSSAIMERRESAPRGVVWLHLHETWARQPAS